VHFAVRLSFAPENRCDTHRRAPFQQIEGKRRDFSYDLKPTLEEAQARSPSPSTFRWGMP
jgi:hypothetical protein